MNMFSILSWVIFGAIIGWFACLLHPAKEKLNLLGVILLGIVGSFVGGGINYLVGWGGHLFSSSGILMSIVGAVITIIVFDQRDKILGYFNMRK